MRRRKRLSVQDGQKPGAVPTMILLMLVALLGVGPQEAGLAPPARMSVPAQRIYLDEQRRPAAPPPGIAATHALPPPGPGTQTLVQRASEVPGRGVMVDLRGQLNSYVVATKTPGGTLRVLCTPAPDTLPVVGSGGGR